MAISSRFKSIPLAKSVYLTLVLVCFVLASGLTGFYLGRKSDGYDLNVPAAIIHPFSTGDDASQKVDFNLFWQSWNIINSKFYGTPNNTDRLNGAIGGMVASLNDPYTVYFPPTQNKLFQSDLQGNFGGIGAELEVRSGALTVVSALDGTPADKAGLKGGDVILEIDGSKASSLNFNDAVNKIRGTKGTQVVLTIGRPGTEQPFKVTLTRDTIVVKSVITDSIGPNNSIAYIKVNQFGQDTVTLFQQALEQAKTDQKKGLVIDLRDNPGGYLDAAVQAIGSVVSSNPTGTSQALKDRIAVEERFKDGTKNDHRALNAPILDSIPMVVLVNGGSASASEIFAGAMRDYNRAQLVGTKTFGKGSVQELDDLPNGGSVKVTIAKWFTPLGVGIDGKGLNPDVVVNLPDNTVTSTSDAQVAKALDILQQQIK